MKRLLLYTALLGILIQISSCKKDKGTSSIAITGLWQVTYSDASIPDLKFIKFTDSKELFTYSQGSSGFRTVGHNNFTPEEDQIIANFLVGYAALNVYNYSVSGNTLTIIADNGITFITATQSTSTDPDNWVTAVTSTDHIDNLFTGNNNGIGFDGNNLLFVDYSAGKINKVSLGTRTIVGTITTTTNSLNTVEYDGTDYWVSRDGEASIKKVNSSGAVIFTSTANLGSWVTGIGFISPSSIICYANSKDTLYNYNPTADAISQTKNVDDVTLGDMAISNGKVFILENYGNIIYRVDPATFAVEKAYQVTDAQSVTGIAAVGNDNFWLSTQGGQKILKVTLN